MIWGIEEWQFNIPSGSRKIKSIPRGPRGISGNEIFLNLHAYYKKSQFFSFCFTQFSKVSCEISNFLKYFDCPHYLWMRKSEESKIATTICSWQGCEFLKKSWFSNFRGPRGIWRRPRGAEIKSIPRGIGEWKKVWDLGERGMGNSLCHP